MQAGVLAEAASVAGVDAVEAYSSVLGEELVSILALGVRDASVVTALSADRDVCVL